MRNDCLCFFCTHWCKKEQCISNWLLWIPAEISVTEKNNYHGQQKYHFKKFETYGSGNKTFIFNELLPLLEKIYGLGFLKPYLF